MSTPSSVPERSGADKTINRTLVMVGLMLAMGLAAMDGTIVSTAIPTIVSDLGGFALFPWVFSIYLLAQALTIPIYGKLADLYGRKPILLLGVGLFVLGSVLSGFSWNMWALIAFRGLQGLGAGAVMPITTTIVGDIFNLEERARMQGYISSVWGIASVIAPALGGAIVQYGHWQWVFFLNLPVGALAAFMIVRQYREHVVRRPHRIDYAGAGLLASGVGLILVGLLEGGVGWAWVSLPSLGVFAVGAILLVLFYLNERRAEEPMLPVWVFSEKMLTGANLATMVLGMMLIGLSTFIPTFVQGVLGATPIIAGFTLVTMSIGWPLASTASGRIYLNLGFRNTAMIGAGCSFLSGIIFLLLTPHSSPVHVALGSFVMGVGLGFGTTAIVVGVQSVVGWNKRGVVTGANMFMRMLGASLGAAILGGIVNATLAHSMRQAPQSLQAKMPHSLNATSLLLNHSLQNISAKVHAYVSHALFQGVHNMFWGMLILAVIAFGLEWLMPARTEAVDDEPT